MIARTFKEVGKKPIDFQSFNHIMFGFIAYLLLFSITKLISEHIIFLDLLARFGWSCFLALGAGAGWELIENLGFPDAFFRIWGLDSLENSLMDIFFDLVGIIIAFFLSIFDNWNILLVSGFSMMVILVFAMYVLMKLTQPKE